MKADSYEAGLISYKMETRTQEKIPGRPARIQDYERRPAGPSPDDERSPDTWVPPIRTGTRRPAPAERLHIK